MIDIETQDFTPTSTSSTSTSTSTSTNRVTVSQKNSRQILLEIEHVSSIKL